MGRVCPDVIEPLYAICTAEQVQLVAPSDHRMVRSRWGYLTMWWSAVYGILYEDLPTVRGLLQCVQVECDEVVEKVAFYLSAKDVDFAAENVQGMSVAARRSRARR